jgi:hypothetical protein
MRRNASRVLAATVAAAMALPVINLQPASAASPTPAKVTKPAGDLELSSRKRHRHYRHHGNAAAFGAVATMFGTVAALAAASRYRDRHYYHSYGYHHAPYHYGAYSPYGYPSGGYYYYR